jgi:hypothetical protein
MLFNFHERTQSALTAWSLSYSDDQNDLAMRNAADVVPIDGHKPIAV